MNKLCAKILIIASIFFLITPGSAHDIHISYCQSQLTPTSLAGKVSFYKDDFMKALRNWSGNDPKSLSRQQVNQMILQYLRQNFRVTAGGNQDVPFIKIIKGEDNLSVWFQFEFSGSKNLQSISIENRVLFKEYNDQTNLMLVKTPGGEHNLVFTSSEPSGVVTL